ncbi:MAG: NAD(P)-dependent glycerol-3-phosphate dehydrogenase [Olsenella sp.]|nr:NAD(P)-dependent glycerol-3-phosphate dehydrogenase [Olsenella sp.]
MSRIAVIGAGSWGTAMTGLVAPAVDEVVLWARTPQAAETMNRDRRNPNHLVDYTLAPNVVATSCLADAVRDVDAAILATPSAYLRQTCHNLAPHLSSDARVLVLSKGMERGSHLLMHEVASEELGNPSRVAALSGPNHAEEICKGMVSAAVVASEDAKTAEYFQGLLSGPTFRAYVSDDVRGVECCGAVKNVVAIACGIASGMGMGDNTLAVLMTRGIAEIGRVVAALGGNPMTCMGLAGMGDLVVTCTSEHSRNRSFGKALVAGETLEGYQARTHMVVEGAPASESVLELAHERSIEVPITAGVHAVLYEGLPIDEAMEGLLTRVPRTEFYGMEEREPASKENQC